MINQNNHIVARCYWDTTFDAKENGIELQNKLSHWSEHHMPREIDAVFNSICPKEQTIKIKTLELDLGSINYENLTEDLGIKLRAQLQLLLSDIIMYPNKHGQSIEILREGNSHLNMLKYFLLQGVMPWDYQEIKGTINQVVDNQLSNNRHEVIEMIQSIGIEEYVRRRMAWQLKEPNIKRIIESIERSNLNYIIDFSEEFVKIQERETIVKTGIHDFKKNLWFWILNYLFVERGTMFNKIDFVRSNIQQMANHFNIEYSELFKLIEDAVHKVHENSYVKTNFILILSILSERQSSLLSTKFSSEKQLEKNWELLQYFFKSSKNRTTTYQKKRFGELIQSLSVVSPSKFKNRVNSIENKVQTWMSISQDLEESALKILLHTLSPVKATKIFNQVASIKKLELQKHFNLKENWILGKSFQFLKQHDTEIYSNTIFIDFVLKEISISQKISKTKVLEKVVYAKVLSSQKSIETVGFFKHLKQLYAEEMKEKSILFSKERLLIILNQLKNTSLKLDSVLLENYYETIRLWTTESPREVWNVLMRFQDKQYIQKIVPTIFNEKRIQKVVLKKLFPKYYELIKELEIIIDTISDTKIENDEVLRRFKNSLLIEGISVLVFNKNLNLKSFISLLLVKFKVDNRGDNALNHKKNIQYIIEKLNNKKKNNLEFEDEALKYIIAENVELTELDTILKYVEQHKNKQNEVAEILGKLVHEKKFKTSEFVKNEKIISNYLLFEGYSLQQEFINIYAKKNNFLVKKYTSVEVEKIIVDGFWQCIAEYSNYRGNKTKFKELLKKVMTYYFEDPKKERRTRSKVIFNTENNKIEKPKRVLNTISIIELTGYLKEAIEQNKDQIEVKGKRISFKKIFYLGLEEAPQEIRVLLKKIPFSKQLVNVLKSAIPFQQFIALIAKDKLSSKLNLISRGIESLYTLVSQIGGESLIGKVEDKFWKYSIKFIQSKRVSTKELIYLTDIVMDEFSNLSTINIAAALNHIKNEKSTVPAVLKEILITKSTTFELLITDNNSVVGDSSKELKLCYKKGKLEDLCELLVLDFKIPSWFIHSKSITNKILISEILEEHPLQILSVLRKNNISNAQVVKLSKQIHIPQLFKVLSQLYPGEKYQFTTIEKFYKTIKNISLKGMTPEMIQNILFEKLIRSWVSSNWKLIHVSSIWKELLWEISAKRNIEENSFFKAFEAVKNQLPLPLQITYDSLIKEKKSANNKDKSNQAQKNIKLQKEILLNTGVAVPNAGIVLLNSYFLMLLERLYLVKNKQFISSEARLESVHYLQYLVTGMNETEESLLVLNKLLCGIELHQPIKEGIEISKEDENLINGLIKSAIGYWSAIGNTSINGFRGNWLVRNGILSEEEEHWTLTVEKRPYDVLMIKSPFSFSIIKLPWMVKPLHVTWPF